MNPPPTWRKSTRCGNSTCVEVATGDQGALMRDSKLPDSPVLTFDRQAWNGFLDDIRAGALDLR